MPHSYHTARGGGSSTGFPHPCGLKDCASKLYERRRKPFGGDLGEETGLQAGWGASSLLRRLLRRFHCVGLSGADSLPPEGVALQSSDSEHPCSGFKSAMIFAMAASPALMMIDLKFSSDSVTGEIDSSPSPPDGLTEPD